MLRSRCRCKQTARRVIGTKEIKQTGVVKYFLQLSKPLAFKVCEVPTPAPWLLSSSLLLVLTEYITFFPVLSLL
jgi:hypothetical protein